MFVISSKTWRRAALGCCLLLTNVHPRLAQGHDKHTQHPPHKDAVTLLTLEQAVSLGFRQGPEGSRAKTPLAAVREMTRTAAPTLGQLPYVQAQLGPRLSPGGHVTPELIVSVAQPFTLYSASRVQTRVAEATSKSLAADTKNAQLVDAERAAHAWLDLALADEVLRLRQDFVAQADRLLGHAQARVAAGEGQPLEVALAQSDLADASSLVIDAEGAHNTAELGLAYALGMAPGAHVDVDGRLPPAIEAPPIESGQVHPSILAAESRKELALEQVNYVKVQQSPLVALGVQYQREGTGDQVLTAIATIPLPVARPWAFQEAQQRVAADQARADENFLRDHNAVETAHAHHETAHSLSQLAHLEQAALPPLREAHRLALVRYSNGAAEFTEVSLVRQRLLRAEEQLAQALANTHHARVRFLAATGCLSLSNLR